MWIKRLGLPPREPHQFENKKNTNMKYQITDKMKEYRASYFYGSKCLLMHGYL